MRSTRREDEKEEWHFLEKKGRHLRSLESIIAAPPVPPRHGCHRCSTFLHTESTVRPCGSSGTRLQGIPTGHDGNPVRAVTHGTSRGRIAGCFFSLDHSPSSPRDPSVEHSAMLGPQRLALSDALPHLLAARLPIDLARQKTNNIPSSTVNVRLPVRPTLARNPPHSFARLLGERRVRAHGEMQRHHPPERRRASRRGADAPRRVASGGSGVLALTSRCSWAELSLSVFLTISPAR